MSAVTTALRRMSPWKKPFIKHLPATEGDTRGVRDRMPRLERRAGADRRIDAAAGARPAA
jgi:hypothetical protein